MKTISVFRSVEATTLWTESKFVGFYNSGIVGMMTPGVLIVCWLIA